MSTIQDLPVRTPPERRPRHSKTPYWVAALVLAAASGGGLVALQLTDDEPRPEPSATASPTPAPSPSASEPTSPSPQPTTPADRSSIIWPFQGTTYGDPVELARAFAVSYLKFQAPVIGPFRQGDSRSGEVSVRPAANGPTTTVLVRQVGAGSDWSVIGATTQYIEVTEPDVGDVVRSPLRVTGRALAFEGQVEVEIRQDGEVGALGKGYVTGGGSEMSPFAGSIPFTRPTQSYGTIVLYTVSAENGQVWSAGAVRVRLSPQVITAKACGSFVPSQPEPGAGEMRVTVYYTCDATGDAGELIPVYRIVPQSAGVLRASLEQLLAGPTVAELDGDLSSWFSTQTANMVRGVSLSQRHAFVDFKDLRTVIPNASSSAGSRRLLSQLDATVFQFGTVTSVEYRLLGSCSDFNEWLQFGGCPRRLRPS